MFPLVKGSFVEMFRNDEGRMTAFFVIFAFGCGHGTCECCPMYDFVIIRVHFNTILASFSFLILFNFRTVPGPRRPYFSRFSILPFASASVKCIAAMNFIYSTDPFPILFWKFMMRGYSKIWTFSVLLFDDIYFSSSQHFSSFFWALFSPFKLLPNSPTMRLRQKEKFSCENAI